MTNPQDSATVDLAMQSKNVTNALLGIMTSTYPPPQGTSSPGCANSASVPARWPWMETNVVLMEDASAKTMLLIQMENAHLAYLATTKQMTMNAFLVIVTKMEQKTRTVTVMEDVPVKWSTIKMTRSVKHATLK